MTAAQSGCRAVAELNGVAHRVQVGGLFQGADFSAFTGRKTWLVMDIEGGERELLDPVAYPTLHEMAVLVECHDCFVPGMSTEIARRFADSHTIVCVDHQLAATPLPDWLQGLGHLDHLLATSLSPTPLPRAPPQPTPRPSPAGGRGSSCVAFIAPLPPVGEGAFMRSALSIQRNLRMIAIMKALFVELPAFSRFRGDYLDDEGFRVLQNALASNPEAGEVIEGTGGLRKLRHADARRGKGKRGGLRVIYFWWEPGRQFWLFTLYNKDELADLTAKAKRALKDMLKLELEARR